MITVTVYLTFLQPLFDVYCFPTSIYTYMYCRMIQKGGLAYNVNSVFSIVKGHSLSVPSGMILQRYDSGVMVIHPVTQVLGCDMDFSVWQPYACKSFVFYTAHIKDMQKPKVPAHDTSRNHQWCSVGIGKSKP